jgi:tetratricopeptide (TPR) repeat protein
VKKSVAVLIIFSAVLACYAPALRDGFVWDDTALVLRDPLIRSWRLIPECFNHFLFVDATASDFYRPLQRLTYMLDYAAFSFRPGPYHAVSILWHAAAATALFFFAEELLLAFEIESRKRHLIAFFGALVWAIHPVESAAVAYIAGRADPLAALFGFLALYLILRGSRARGAGQLIFLIAAGVALLSSVLSKETGLVFPAIATGLFVLRKDWIGVCKVAVVAAFVGVIYLSLRLAAEHTAPALTAPAPPLVRPIIMSRAVAEYGGLILLPLHLRMDRDVESQPSGFSQASLNGAAWRELQTLLGIVLVGVFLYWMLRTRRRNPATFTCLVFAVISYLPVSGIITLNATVAEHWIYLPGSFLFLATAIEFVNFVQNRQPIKPIGIAAITLIVLWIVFLGGRTLVRTFDWKDQRTFLEQTIASGSDSARMLINLGDLELSNGELEDAAMHFHAALEKKPEQPFAILNLAAVAIRQKDFKLARQLLRRATQMPLVAAQAYEFLAVLENKENGRVDLMRLRLAARTGPPNWSIEKRYIKVLDESGATASAINELVACLRTQWYRAESWQLLSELETKARHADQAANALTRACAYDVHLSAHGAEQ